ncbi:EamA family transporter [Candidatus Nomurabacteria bacterium]|nr:EamA family transporter [Candidatus Nomurabacteria bacterium]
MDFSVALDVFAKTTLFFTLPWVIFSLLSTLSDVCVGFIDELLLQRLSTDSTTESLDMDAPGQLLLVSGFFGLVISLIVYLAACLTDSVTLIFSKVSLVNAVGAGMIEVLWLIPYFYALQRGGALRVTPLFQSVPIFALLFGYVLFAEFPTTIHIVASLFILCGAFLLNYSPEIKQLDKKTVGLMFLASSLISLGYFLFKDAAEISNFATALLGNGIGMALLSIVIWILWKPYRSQFWNRVRSFKFHIIALQTLNEGLYAISAFFNQLALVFGPSVMLVSTMNSFHPLFTLVIGGVLAKTGIPVYEEAFKGTAKYLKVSGILLIVIGTIVIAS